jgi:predicted transcriptional regulator
MARGRPWRPDLYVVARFLEHLWRAEAPMGKTRLQVAANVNFDVFSRYLEWMRAKGLIAIEAATDGREAATDGRERVALTPDGAEAYRKIVQWIDEVVHGRLPGK